MTKENNGNSSEGYTEEEIKNMLDEMIAKGQIVQLNVDGEKIITVPKVISDAEFAIFQEMMNLPCLLTVEDIFNQKNIKDYIEKTGFKTDSNVYLEVLRTSVEKLVSEGKLLKVSRNQLIYYHYYELDGTGLKTLKEIEEFNM